MLKSSKLTYYKGVQQILSLKSKTNEKKPQRTSIYIIGNFFVLLPAACMKSQPV